MKHQRSARPGNPGFTPQQIVILILFALLGTSTLALAGYMLLSGNAAVPADTHSAQAAPGSAALPPTWTASPDVKGTPAPENAQKQPMPALPASCAQAGTGFEQGTAQRVIDGSTVEVQVGDSVLRVGYAGIQVALETANPGDLSGQLAAQKARELLEGQPVILVKDASEQDSAGRLVRYVFSGSRFINYELARQGLATVLTNSPDQACAAFLQQAEQQAREEKLGIWQSTPVPTRTFVPLVTLDPNKAGCDCTIKYQCSNFKTHAEAQKCLNTCNDYSSKLDDDRDGIACENLP